MCVIHETLSEAKRAITRLTAELTNVRVTTAACVRQHEFSVIAANQRIDAAREAARSLYKLPMLIDKAEEFLTRWPWLEETGDGS